MFGLLGAKAFGWSWVASETDATSFDCARRNVQANGLQRVIELRKPLETTAEAAEAEAEAAEGGAGPVPPPGPLLSALRLGAPPAGDGDFDFCVTNPPFFASRHEAVRDHPLRACPGVEV